MKLWMNSLRIIVASAIAEIQIDKCLSGLCGEAGGSDLKRIWKNAIAITEFGCPKDGYNSRNFYANSEQIYSRSLKKWGYALTHLEESVPETYLPASSFGNISADANDGASGCLAQRIAHETLHSAAARAVLLGGTSTMFSFWSMPVANSLSLKGWTSLAANVEKYLSPGWKINLEIHPNQAHELWVKQLSTDCVSCGN